RKPMGKRLCVTSKQRVEDKRGKGKIVDPVHLARNFQLLRVVAMDLDQHFDAEGVSFGSQRVDEAKSFRNHETTCPGFLDCVADGIQSNHPYSSRLKLAENGLQIGLTLRVLYVDVNLLRRECRPKKTTFP